MRYFLILLFSYTANAQELTPTQIGAINKADSLSLAAWNLALKNGIYSLNSALGKTNTVLTAKNRAQDSLIGLVRDSEKALKDSSIAHFKNIVLLTAKNLSQDKLITVLTSKIKSEDSLIAIIQKQLSVIKTSSDNALSASNRAIDSLNKIPYLITTPDLILTYKSNNVIVIGIGQRFNDRMKAVELVHSPLKKVIKAKR